ncbi:L-serine ammonia-lyase [Sphingomonas donggukensis]|uniref:L-serine dehydratase n=1 Tax=Sphingomonas donggukensis TaxID=2949093 RepID=A0ABY4TRX1_9SPHN|nr:L-serine ammonia-lyase [Sphingomonas donggukensis]URW74575.1 L-serine ammonia-lyase [Sphingomonas donggukensis]
MTEASLSVRANIGRPISVVELFTIGIGPSSSHTVGPMRAARAFAGSVADRDVARVTATLHGSLALTGRGHATDTAVLVGLSGWEPEKVDPDAVPDIVAGIAGTHRLMLDGERAIDFDPERDLVFDYGFLPGHPNGMTFVATLANGGDVTARYYSIGGGAIAEEGAVASRANVSLPFPFSSGEDMLALAAAQECSIADLERANEAAWRSPEDTDAFLDEVRQAMFDSIARGVRCDGILPGGLQVKRRAKALHTCLMERGPRSDPSAVFDWVSLWALAVNEENAAGGRVVTAPTNGAAGVIPAVLKYYEAFVHGATRAGARDLLLTASAIGSLYKKRASISAAEMGCQGEVGVACSMAAAGLAAALGGTPPQVENAAEIGMEHNLGLTCDPIGGLVQIPCIERNTMGAIKAINAAYLALHGDGSHVVSLDAVIETMRQTGEDMRSKYKETSQGGLAVNVVEC